MRTKQSDSLISIVVPVYNESEGITIFHSDLIKSLKTIQEKSFEIIYVDDGSSDSSLTHLHAIAAKDKRIRVLGLSRNFGKEIAITAGITHAIGDAVITLDADGQHPVELIPRFIVAWEKGYHVVIGIRTKNQKEGFVKRYGSQIFYKIFNKMTGVKLIPGSTDFRPIDRFVQQEFIKMTERNRITRGLIDWLGYKKEYIEFEAKARELGVATYSFKKLFMLALDSTISLSSSPLYFSSILGAFIIPFSILLVLLMTTEMLAGDPLGLHITGSAYLVVMVLFLIGILLFSQGILGLYLKHIHSETQNRPLYVINHHSSIRYGNDKKHIV